ncbi:MAG: sulfatase-like hydrolase/transferase [Bryobacteraceae bacterium]|nr:sulfatase-like hydrolase/transferase [Bryobacteraceae bacterium]
MDQGTGRVLDTLERLNAARDTPVVFTHDNGAERLSDNRPWFHPKGTLWEGGIHVPGLMCWPGVTRPGSASAVPCASMDFAATIMAACGVKTEKPTLPSRRRSLRAHRPLHLRPGARREAPRRTCRPEPGRGYAPAASLRPLTPPAGPPDSMAHWFPAWRGQCVYSSIPRCSCSPLSPELPRTSRRRSNRT